jgi:glycine cleavage system H protein
MPRDLRNTTYFRQARFTARLPNQYLYSPAHYWLEEIEPGLWRVGLTRFATRMLGDFVELSLTLTAGEKVAVGETIGWIEGFKAVTDLYCSVQGEFAAVNAEIARQPHLVDVDPHDKGWLYQVRGTPADNVLDVAGYVAVLNATIEKMLSEQKAQEDKKC